MPLEPGQSLAHYRIVRQIGQGGMGAVFLAEDTKLDRRVVLKVLPPDMAASPDRLVRIYERNPELDSEAGSGMAWHAGALAMLYGKADNMDRARQELRQMEERAASGSYVPPCGFARAFLGLGDMDRCFQWLDRAATERDPLFIMGLSRSFSDITGDPRWPALEAQMNYPQ